MSVCTLVYQYLIIFDKFLFSAVLQMSNEIIRLCFQSISLDRIFKGYVISSEQNLCIWRCLAWKEIYLRTSQIHHK